MGFLDKMSNKGGGLRPEYLTPPQVQVPTWEYAFIQVNPGTHTRDEVQKMLNDMGAYGWELATASTNHIGMTRAGMDDATLYTFKRRTS